jgi:hypothetical protein
VIPCLKRIDDRYGEAVVCVKVVEAVGLFTCVSTPESPSAAAARRPYPYSAASRHSQFSSFFFFFFFVGYLASGASMFPRDSQKRSDGDLLLDRNVFRGPVLTEIEVEGGWNQEGGWRESSSRSDGSTPNDGDRGNGRASLGRGSRWSFLFLFSSLLWVGISFQHAPANGESRQHEEHYRALAASVLLR